jgi:hypothetical protein
MRRLLDAVPPWRHVDDLPRAGKDRIAAEAAFADIEARGCPLDVDHLAAISEHSVESGISDLGHDWF